MIITKTPEEIEKIAAAGKLVAQALEMAAAAAEPGVESREIDLMVEEFIRAQDAVPTFKGYHGYPASICVSINDGVVHGIPGSRRFLEGDIVSFDVGVTLSGFVGDAAVTVPVGEVDDVAARLIQVTRRALEEGIDQAWPGNHLSDISHAVQLVAEEAGFSVVREFVGHGIGRAMHEDPQIPNFGTPGHGPVLEEGMVLALEPMINSGGPEVVVLPDKWTVKTADGGYSAHFEHTAAVTADGPRVLTLL